MRRNATGGNAELTTYTHSCRFCGTNNLAWGSYGNKRRLFESDGVLHSCLRRKKERCDSAGFESFSIPIESYANEYARQ